MERSAPLPSISAGAVNAVQARAHLDASLIPGSIDEIFVRVAERFDGFAGAYENEAGELVLVSKAPETNAARMEIARELLDMVNVDERLRSAYLGRQVQVQVAEFDFIELAVYRQMVERSMRSDMSILTTDVDERLNRLVIGIDELGPTAEVDVISHATAAGVPSTAIIVDRIAMPEAVAGTPEIRSTGGSDPNPRPEFAPPSQLTDYVRPLAGGLQIDTDGRCTLGIPVWYGASGSQTRGFLTASHCTKHVGVDYNRVFGQAWQTNVTIGVEQEDPPLTNCGSGSTNCHLVDAALIDINSVHDNATMTHTGSVYLTDYSSSTGYGGLTISDELDVLHTWSPFVGQNVNKVGRSTGWTTGQVTGTCVTLSIVVRHPDGVNRATILPCYVRASTPVFGGDSGSALVAFLYDPEPDSGNFMGILSACSGCSSQPSTVAYYVSWAAINQAMTSNITLIEDHGGE